MRLLVAAPNIYEGDAVGNHCLGITRLASRLDIECHLFAQGFDSGSSQVRDIESLFSIVHTDDTLLVIHSIYDPNFNRLIRLPCRKICYFHGITSPYLFDAFSPELADLCRRGLDQTTQFNIFDVVIGNSKYTLSSISEALVAERSCVIPPVFSDMPSFQQKSLRIQRASGGMVRLLSVGRVVPHKRIEDAITLLHGTRARGINASLTVVGSLPSFTYFEFLIQHARNLDVLNKIDFSGALADCDLFRVYQSSDILITTSLHEGFCVPVLEALSFSCGVLVRNGTASGSLAESEEIFEMDNDIYPEKFFEALSSVRQKQGFGNWTDNCEARVKSVLEGCSDRVWESILRSEVTSA
jgi:glycosyltransferase involved in cell wall biosynthesis